ncbi:ANTAR domain-containing protein [Streptomyces sp. NPDC093982]|uniref:ANTAR domain-containing protein n=1 Tax=Streptomyces sp. NPDC093982 TaxID=3155077 RepID=UPI0034262B6C
MPPHGMARSRGFESATLSIAYDTGQSAQRADTGRGSEVNDTAELLREEERLEHAIANRPVIDMACEVLTAGSGCDQEEAWEILEAVSQHANLKMGGGGRSRQSCRDRTAHAG